MRRFLKWMSGFFIFETFRSIHHKTNHLHEKIECVNRKSKMLLHAMENDRMVDKEV